MGLSGQDNGSRFGYKIARREDENLNPGCRQLGWEDRAESRTVDFVVIRRIRRFEDGEKSTGWGRGGGRGIKTERKNFEE